VLVVGVCNISEGICLMKTLFRQSIIVAMTIGICAAGEQKHTRVSKEPTETCTLPSADIEMLHAQIRRVVKELEYSDAVAEAFVKMVSRWKDVKGRPGLIVLKKMLDGSKEACRRGEISKVQLAEIEEGIMVDLGLSIQKQIAYRTDYFDLANIIRNKTANCFGYSQLFYILGNSVRLSVWAMSVMPGHIANIVSLSDGTMTIVDLVRTSGFISERIITEGGSERNGSHWKFKDKSNLVRGNRTIHILDRNELVGEIHFCRGTVHYISGQGPEAIFYYDRAIELNPKCAKAYNNRGGAYLTLSERAKAISNFNQAIELDPDYASAYHNRANAYLDSGEYTKAALDYTNVIERDPEFAKAYFGRGYARLALGHYTQAISDYTKTIEFNPEFARAYYTRAIGYAYLTENEKAKKDMLQAVELDHTLKTDVERVSDELKLNLKLD